MQIINIIVDTVLKFISFGVILMIAIDLVSWTKTGEGKDNASGFIAKFGENIVKLPIYIIYGIFDVIVGVVEGVIKMVFSLIGLKSVAEQISFYKLSSSLK